ncbi:unnamed protein product [[Candida] boidinii]|uniref:Unnamed protein product n=1 Tax=Candida boidinii TaxID=5477 RepID=A0ACB5TXA4_CANBO|nr:unnamed protein product [[Candida] boidinii]
MFKSSIRSLKVINHNLQRQISSTATTADRPLLLDVLPSRKFIKRLLFDMDAKMNYNKYLPVLEKIYDTMDNNKIDDKGQDLKKIYSKLTGKDLVIFQNVLKEIRTQTHTSNKNLVDLESALIERAGELGNRDAITMLCFKALEQDSNTGSSSTIEEPYTDEEKRFANLHIMKLLKLNHPLTFKMSGDFAFKNGRVEDAVKFYNQFIKLDPNSFLTSEVYKSMGIIEFRNSRLIKSKYFFEKSIALAPSSKVSQCHYFLGQIYEDDPLRSRYHFEMSAAEGFRESFASLGFLELNYFHDAYKAKHWFLLGSELGDVNCMIGVFDSYIRVDDLSNAAKAFNKIKKFLNEQTESVNFTWDQFLKIREESIDKLSITGLINEINIDNSLSNENLQDSKWNV